MAKQRDIAALREDVRSSAYTPPVKDIEGLAELLGEDDEELAHCVETALVRAASGGTQVVPRLLATLSGASAAARARGFRVVGRLAPTDAVTAKALLAGLSETDERVRRGAVHALGRLKGSAASVEIAAALLETWDEAPELPLAKALAEAMGKLGVEEARGRLESVAEGDAELARISRKAVAMLRRDGSRGEVSEIRGESVGEFDVEVVLSCRAGIEGIVSEELGEKCASARSIRTGTGQVTALWRGAPQELLIVRTALGVAFALAPESVPEKTDAELERACVRALSSKAARQIVETWTSGTVRYRLEWEGHGHRRGTTWRVVHALQEHNPSWINDPTESTWVATVRAAKDDQVRVFLSPRKLTDPRFLYRVTDVPAASHPTLAAALVRASRPRADDVVWDPFVGSGSELIERARAGPYQSLSGSDLDSVALAAARANAAAASVPLALELGDATEVHPPNVTSILTNPPMGRRVARDGSLAELLDRFTDHAALVLVPGGRLTWLSPLGGRTAARAESNGLRVTLRQSVDMGGFHAELQVWEKALS